MIHLKWQYMYIFITAENKLYAKTKIICNGKMTSFDSILSSSNYIYHYNIKNLLPDLSKYYPKHKKSISKSIFYLVKLWRLKNKKWNNTNILQVHVYQYSRLPQHVTYFEVHSTLHMKRTNALIKLCTVNSRYLYIKILLRFYVIINQQFG